MDLDPVSVKSPTEHVKSSSSSLNGHTSEDELEDPYSFNGPYITILGLTIAFATIGIPLFAVLYENPLARQNIVPLTLERHGSSPSSSFSFSRVSKPGS